MKKNPNTTLTNISTNCSTLMRSQKNGDEGTMGEKICNQYNVVFSIALSLKRALKVYLKQMQQARKPRSYASSKLRLTESRTGVKCRAKSVAKKANKCNQWSYSSYADSNLRKHIIAHSKERPLKLLDLEYSKFVSCFVSSERLPKMIGCI